MVVQWLNQALCIYQRLCLVDSDVLRNRHLRVATKRCVQYSITITMNEIALKTIIGELAKQSTPLLKGLKAEADFFFNDGLGNYLEKQRAKFTNVKTLLHRTTPVPFYDIYFPVTLSCKSKKISTTSVNKVFLESQFITIIGDAGSGKSTLIKHLFLNSIEENFCIPILVELRYLNDFKGSVEEFLREKIFENRLSPTEAILTRLLDNGRFVFFLDGYDEIKSDAKESVVEKLNIFIDKYRQNRFLLTSRPYSNIELLPLFHNYTIEKLNDSDINEFILKQKIEQELAEKIIRSISENKVRYIKSYLTNPLLLSLYILTFSTNSSIPSKKYIFYRRVLDVLFKEHDSITKIGYERELLTKLSQEEFEEILKIFSFISYFDGEYDFERDYLNSLLDKIKKKKTTFSFDNNKLVEDLKSAIALWTEDSGVYAFAHRSMQEYFAALYIKSINENKQEAYKKIQDRLFAKRRRVETSNFLSLCDEMDSYYYRKHMLLPALLYIRSQIDNTSENTLISSTLAFFFKSISIQLSDAEDHNTSISLNQENRKFIFAIEMFEVNLVGHLFHVAKLKSFLKYIFDDRFKILNTEKKRERNLYQLNLTSIEGQILKILIRTKLLENCRELYTHLQANIESTERYLKESFDSEKNFIDDI